jgi:hypothetical protein
VAVVHENFDIPLVGQLEESFLVGLNAKVDGAETSKGINHFDVLLGTVPVENIQKRLPSGTVTTIALVEAFGDEVDGLLCIEFGQLSRPLISCTLFVVNTNVVVVVAVEFFLLVKREISILSVACMTIVLFYERDGVQLTWILANAHSKEVVPCFGEPMCK